MPKEKVLTVKQARKQGFTAWGYAGEQWQQMQDLGDLEENNSEDAYLFEKEPEKFAQVKSEDMLEWIGERVAADWFEETYDDDSSDLEIMIKQLGPEIFKEAAKKINEAIGAKSYYKLTKIKVVL